MLSVLALAVTCSGCFLFPSADSSPPPVSDPITTTGTAQDEWALEVGTGESAFESLEDGARIAKVRGPQGGHHIPLTARLRGQNVRDELAPDATAYAQVEIEVTVRGAIESRSVSLYGAAPENERASIEILYLNGYVGEAARGDGMIKVKIATADGTKWAEASRRVVID